MRDRNGNEHGRDGKFRAQQRAEGDVPPLIDEPGRWPHGAEQVKGLLELDHLERIEVNRDFVETQLDHARRSLDTAEQAAGADPRGAYVAMYDAGRLALEAVLARQGLRPTRKGGHTVAIDAIQAQVGQAGSVVKPMHRIRQRRHDAEYPYPDTPLIEEAEVREDLPKVRDLVTAMGKFVERVGEF